MKTHNFGMGDKTSDIRSIQLGDEIQYIGKPALDYLALNKGYTQLTMSDFSQVWIVKDTMGRTNQIYLNRDEIVALYKFVMGEGK